MPVILSPDARMEILRAVSARPPEPEPLLVTMRKIEAYILQGAQQPEAPAEPEPQPAGEAPPINLATLGAVP